VKVREPASSQEVRVSTTIVNRVMDSQQAILSADAAGDFRFKSSESMIQSPIRSVMCAPLIDADGKTFGALQIDTVNYRGRFQEEDLHVFVAVATQASIAFDNARLHEMALRQRDLERDLELADQIQRSFLPAGLPQIAGYRFFDYYHPASYVGGDYYQYLPLADGRLAIVVADVVGHGLAAAMLTAKLAADVRYQLLTDGPPAEAIVRLNRSLSATMGDNHFVTLVLVVLDPKSGQLAVVNAGHPPPLIRPPGGEAAEIGIQGSGLPLGVVTDATYEETAIQVPRGGLVAVYTDGIREAVNAQKEVFGLPRLCEKLRAASGDPQQIGQGIVDDVRQFIGSSPQADDMCLVCFERE
jgi:serine phosphatase RsbU (regulator of sigma subunit)